MSVVGKDGSTVWTLQTDGASRGNPGPAAIAYVLTDGRGAVRAEYAETIGRATNNVAEYRAVIAGLERALAAGAEDLLVKSDSQLMVRQLQGSYKVRSQDLLPLFQQVKQLERGLRRVRFEHVPRGDNKRPDKLANLALDGKPIGGAATNSETAPKTGSRAVAPEPAASGTTAAAAATAAAATAGPVLLRVRYGETDQMGFAYYANYLDWFTVARTDYFRDSGIPYAAWEAQGIYLPVRKAACSYRHPARYDQVLAIQVHLTELTPVRLNFAYEIRLRAGAPGDSTAAAIGALVAEGMTEHAVITADGAVLRLDRQAPDLWAYLQAAITVPQ